MKTTFSVLLTVLVGSLLLRMSGSAAVDCQAEVYRSCNHETAKIYVHAPPLSESSYKVYCIGVQSLVNCLSNARCTGQFIGQYRFLVLQAAIMSQKTLCPSLDYQRLKPLTEEASLELSLPDLENADAESDKCVRKTFLRCAVLFSRDLETRPNICSDFEATVKCFDEKKSECHAKILKDYRQILDNLGMKIFQNAEKQEKNICF